MLAISGKIPAAVSRMLGSKPAALRFFRQAADLAITDPEWERLADVLTELRRQGRPTTDGVASGLPGSARSLFWDHDVENLHWPADRDLIIGRILASGDWRSVTWLRQQLEPEALRQWIVDRRGRGLDAKRLRFWELMVGLPHAQVDEWIRVRQREAWGRRTQA